MPPPYRPPHWSVFAGIPYLPAGPVGSAPKGWVATHGLGGVPTGAIPLPAHQLTRVEVRDICQNPSNPVLFGYVCAMAWGLQGAGLGRAGHVRAAWGASSSIHAKLTVLRAGGLTRNASYNLFCGAGAIQGLGPAYFTKLLYFFQPVPNCYIMDQHAGKSVDLLTGNWVVRMAGNAVSPLNKDGNYQAYCEEVDHMAVLLSSRSGTVISGPQVEEMMMSKGGRFPLLWRSHVRKKWLPDAPAGRYSPTALHTNYPHIPLHCF